MRFKIIAAINAGALPLSCDDCEGDPAQKEYWNCDGHSERVSWCDPVDGDTFKGCPFRFIHGALFGFFEELQYYSKFPGTAPKFHEQTARWLSADRTYSHYYTLYKKLNNGEPI